MKTWAVAGLAAVAVLFAAVALVPVALMAGILAPSTGSYCTAGGSASAVGTRGLSAGPWVNPSVGAVNSAYGMRTNPATGVHQLHSGVDIAAPEGAPIVAVADGVVTIAGVSSGGNTGYMVALDHGGGVQSRYVHLWPEDIHVAVGQRVVAGQYLGDVGASGRVTGPHLHFEIRLNGTPVDPGAYMAGLGVQLGKNDSGRETAARPLAGQGLGRAAAAGQSYLRADGITFRPDPEQVANLAEVAAAGKAQGEPAQAIVVALMTVLQEAGGYIHANSTLPESLDHPHQRVGSDHDSVGLFQQRPSQGWGSIQDLMTPATSARKFFAALHQVPGWQDLAPGDAAQAVQRSAYPDAYARWEPVAVGLYTAFTGGPGAGSGCTPSKGRATSLTHSPDQTRQAILKAAREGLGGRYVPNGHDFKAWDDTGYVYWVCTEAGIRSMPYIDPWTAGTPTTFPQPGDLVVLDRNPDGSWNQVGLHAGGNHFYTVTRTGGTLKAPIPAGAAYFTLAGTP